MSAKIIFKKYYSKLYYILYYTALNINIFRNLFQRLIFSWAFWSSWKHLHLLKVLIYMIKGVLNVPKISITNFEPKTKLCPFAFAGQYSTVFCIISC